jgi:hypothetical protein
VQSSLGTETRLSGASAAGTACEIVQLMPSLSESFTPS